MPTFVCQSIGPEGRLIEVRVAATTRLSAMEQLRAKGHLPVSAAETSGEVEARTSLFTLEKGKFPDKDLLTMTKELSLLLGAGQQLEQALSLASRNAPSSRMQRTLSSILALVRGGAGFADALDMDGNFPPLYIAMTRAGEASGSLDQAIEHLAEMLDRTVRIRETVISALLYPAILVSVAVLSIGLLLRFVVPQFAILFEGAEARLPWITQLVLAASAWIQQYGLFSLIAILVLIVALPRAKSWLSLDAWWDRVVLRLPLIGELIAIQQTARMTRTLGSLHRSGVSLPAALGLASKVVRNRTIIGVVEMMRQGVKDGRTLASALVPGGPIPDLATHLIKVGEESGRLDDVLLQVSDIYDAKFELSVKRVLAILEPTCVIMLGIFIGGIIVSILLAVISVNELAF